nr:hypothetical protein [Tanacetum cinerariifolium]
QGESSSSSLNDDVQQSPKEVILPQTNTQSIHINMVPNGDEASISHNVFNEHLEDAYFDASTLFHDPSNVQTFYQPYPHERKWTKDHPFHKIIGDPKSSVRKRGQLANSCLFSCLLSSIEPSNVAEALKDADWKKFFHESSKLFQEESSSSSLDDDVHKSLEEVAVPSSNTQSVSNNMAPNVDEASTSHTMFNERLEDAYFDLSTSFHDPSNVHTFYQPYPHEKKWTKDHPLHKIISNPKSSVCTRGQLANSCLFSCLLSSIEPANVAEALRDAYWVSAMQDE